MDTALVGGVESPSLSVEEEEVEEEEVEEEEVEEGKELSLQMPVQDA